MTLVSETRYFREDRWVVNGLTFYKFTTACDAASSIADIYKAGNVVAAGGSWGIRVWKRGNAGVETEIDPIGGPHAIYTRNTAHQVPIQVTATWNCPVTALASTDSIVIRTYGKFNNDAWQPLQAVWDWSTEQLGAVSLDASVWTVTYCIDFYYSVPDDLTLLDINFCGPAGCGTQSSFISNFTWTVAPSAQKPELLMMGVGL
jgi:hypothetical protein